MKRIAYIEIDTHAEIAQAFIDIMQGSEEFSVDYYFSEKIRDQITYGEESVYLSDSSMIPDQLKAKNYDLIIVGTVHRYFNTFQVIVQKYNTAIIVHNLNFISASKLRLIKSIFQDDILYRIKLWWKEGLFYSSKVHKKAKNLLVLDPLLSSGKYKFLPLFFTKDFKKAEHEGFVIVIPGGVSQKRRDYKHIFETIENLGTAENFTFVFLGKAKDEELKGLEKVSQGLPENIIVKYFTERVSSEDFESWMQKADVLWCPIQSRTEFFSQQETYGITKMTGNFGDAIKFGKLAVFPDSYPSKLNFILPEKKDILEQFKDLKNNKFDFQDDYNKRTVQGKLEQTLLNLITT